MPRKSTSPTKRKTRRVKRADVLPAMCPYCGTEKHIAAVNLQLGKIAYEAYFAHSNGKSLVSGTLLPPWVMLSPEIKAAWEASASAVSKDVRRYNHIHRTLQLKTRGRWGREGIHGA